MKAVLPLLVALALGCSATPSTEPDAPQALSTATAAASTTSGAAASTTSQAADAPQVEMAPTPFTADQIRDACPVGRKIVFKVEEAGKPEVRRTIEFVKSDAAGADLKITVTDTTGKTLGSDTSHATWEELRSHALFPKKSVQIEEKPITTPLGTFEGLVYKVTEGEGAAAEVTTLHFARKMPGPPVLFFTEKGGQKVRSSTMESNTPGK